jgi:cytochrome c553
VTHDGRLQAHINQIVTLFALAVPPNIPVTWCQPDDFRKQLLSGTPSPLSEEYLRKSGPLVYIEQGAVESSVAGAAIPIQLRRTTMKRPMGMIFQVFCLIVSICPVVARGQSESAGVTQYFNNCASCHESTDNTHQAPRTAVLKQMTPEHVLDVLTNGSMRSNAAGLNDNDKRLIAEWVGGRKLDNESVGCRRKDDEHLLESSAHPRIHNVCVERLGRRSSQYAIADRNCRRTDTCAIIPTAIEVGIRIPGCYGSICADDIRWTSLCKLQCRLRVLARRRLRLRTLGVPRTGRSKKQFHNRPAQPEERSTGGLFR